MYFEISVDEGKIKLQWHLLSTPEIQIFSNDTTNFDWATLFISVDNGKLEAGWRGWELGTHEPSVSLPIDQSAIQHLFSGEFKVYLSGAPESNTVSKLLTSKKYKGCLGEIRINKILLPFFHYNESIKYPEPVTRSHYTLLSDEPEQECVLCFQKDCQNDGLCSNPSDKYACDCHPGYALDDCSENIDECLTARCTNNSTCIDGIASYTCDCSPGYDGKFCENEIDECLSNPCHNGGICKNLIANFSCECTEKYTGRQCREKKQVTCKNQPCYNGSTCVDGYSKFLDL